MLPSRTGPSISAATRSTIHCSVSNTCLPTKKIRRRCTTKMPADRSRHIIRVNTPTTAIPMPFRSPTEYPMISMISIFRAATTRSYDSTVFTARFSVMTRFRKYSNPSSSPTKISPQRTAMFQLSRDTTNIRPQTARPTASYPIP